MDIARTKMLKRPFFRGKTQKPLNKIKQVGCFFPNLTFFLIYNGLFVHLMH